MESHDSVRMTMTRTTQLARPRRRALPVFLNVALRRPGLVGAVAPSSRELAGELATVVPRRGEPAVVELGAGTGSATRAIAARLPQDGRHVAVELDTTMAEHLSARHPDVTVLLGDAADLRELLASAGTASVDAVVSGLPWSLFDETLQRRVLSQVCAVLAPDGGFTTFAYRHAAGLAGARRFRRLLDEYFDEVVVTRTVWRNLPPALVYVCRRPLPSGD